MLGDQCEKTALYRQIDDPFSKYSSLVWYIWLKPADPASIDPPSHTAYLWYGLSRTLTLMGFDYIGKGLLLHGYGFRIFATYRSLFLALFFPVFPWSLWKGLTLLKEQYCCKAIGVCRWGTAVLPCPRASRLVIDTSLRLFRGWRTFQGPRTFRDPLIPYKEVYWWDRFLQCTYHTSSSVFSCSSYYQNFGIKTADLLIQPHRSASILFPWPPCLPPPQGTARSYRALSQL